MGLDFWSPAEWASLDDDMIRDLAVLIVESEAACTPPLQAMLNIIALLPDDEKSDRLVALTAMWYGGWSALHVGSLRPWDEDFLQHWDNELRRA